MESQVPITGVVGVLGGDAGEVASQLQRLRDPAARRPHGVEIRADLFEELELALEAVSLLPDAIPTVFTVRLAAHGGRYEGPEARRLSLYREALERGASLLDAEVGTECARELVRQGAPVVVSYHDFQGTPDEAAMAGVTAELETLEPRAVKLVPTARRLGDTLRILRWVRGARAAGPARVGFAMGSAGFPSRVLCVAWGGAWTYGALGKPAAPGMPSVAELLEVYRVDRLTRSTRIVAFVGRNPGASKIPAILNRALARRALDAVCLPFEIENPVDIAAIVEELPVAVVGVEREFEELALLAAHDEDRTARGAGGADALRVDRSGPRPAVCAYHRSPPGAREPEGEEALWFRAFDLFCHLLEAEPEAGALDAFRREIGPI